MQAHSIASPEPATVQRLRTEAKSLEQKLAALAAAIEDHRDRPARPPLRRWTRSESRDDR